MAQAERRGLLQEAWKAIVKVFSLAVVLDLVYQVTVFRWVYPVESLVVAIILTILPYVLLRGLVNRIAKARAHFERTLFAMIAATELNASTQLALEPTELVHERTLMARLRTSMSLISFGFTLHKLFQYLREGSQSGRRRISCSSRESSRC